MIEVDFDDLKKIELSEGKGGNNGGGQTPPPDVEVWKDDETEDTDSGSGSGGGEPSEDKNESGSSGGETSSDDENDDEGDQNGGAIVDGDETGEEEEDGDGNGSGGEDQDGQEGDESDSGGDSDGNDGDDSESDSGSNQRGGTAAGGKSPKTKGNKIIDILDKKQNELDQHIEDGAKPVAVKVPTNNDQFRPNTEEGKSQEEIEAEQRERLKDAINNSQREIEEREGAGSSVKLPDSFDRDILAPSLNWRNLLRRFLTTSLSVRYDMTRPRKKALAAGYWAAKRVTEKEQLDLVVAIDTSGSITNTMMSIFISEILGIIKAAKEVKARILLWNDEVYEDLLIDTKKMNTESIKNQLMDDRVKSGGTSVNSIKRHLDRKGIRNVSGLLIFTDGDFYGDEANNISLPQAKNKLFLLTPNGKKYPLEKYSTNIYKIDVLSK